MAKQMLIEGTCDKPPKAVEEAAELYLKYKRSVASNREKMNAALDDLIEKMKKAGIKEFLVDDGEKKLILTEKDQVQVKARKASELSDDED